MPQSILPICTLNDEVLELIAAQLDLEDLCNLGRVNRRFFTIVHDADAVWKSLYFQTFGVAQGSAANSSWREHFKKRRVMNILVTYDYPGD